MAKKQIDIGKVDLSAFGQKKDIDLSNIDLSSFGELKKKEEEKEVSKSLEQPSTLVSTPEQEVLPVVEEVADTVRSEEEIQKLEQYKNNPMTLAYASDEDRKAYVDYIRETTEPREKKVDRKAEIKKFAQNLTEETLFDESAKSVDDYYEGLGGMTPAQKMDEFESRTKAIAEKYEDEIYYADPSEIDNIQNSYQNEAKDVASELGLEVTDDGAVKPFDGEITQYQDRLKEEVTRNAMRMEKYKEGDSYLQDLGDRLAAGYQGWSASMVDFTGFLTGANAFKGYRSLSEGSRFRADQLRSQSQRYDNNIQGYAENGEIGKAAGLAISSAVESLPAMIPIFVNPAYGLYVMGAGAGIDRYREVEDKDVPRWRKIAVSVMAGMNEAVWERAVTVPILTRSKQALKQLGKQRGKAVIENAVEASLKNSAYKAGGQMPAWVAEGMSEVATGISNDIADKVYIDPDTQIGSHAFDDFTVGAIMGKVFDAPRSLVSAIEKSDRKRIVQKAMANIPADMEYEKTVDLIEILSEREALTEIENGLADELKGRYGRRIKELTKQADKIIKPYIEEKFDAYVDGRKPTEEDVDKLLYLKEQGVDIPEGMTGTEFDKLYKETKEAELLTEGKVAETKEKEVIPPAKAVTPVAKKEAKPVEKKEKVEEKPSQIKDKVGTELKEEKKDAKKEKVQAEQREADVIKPKAEEEVTEVGKKEAEAVEEEIKPPEAIKKPVEALKEEKGVIVPEIDEVAKKEVKLKKEEDAVQKEIAEEEAIQKEDAKVLKEKAKKIADTLRKAKFTKSMSDLSKLKSDPTAPFQVAWDGAVELAAVTIEAGGTIAQAVADGVKSLKESDWYKSLSKESQKIAENTIKNDITENTKAAEVVPEKEKVRQFGKKVTESTQLPEEVKEEVKKGGIGYIPRGKRVTQKEASELIRIYSEEGGMDKVKFEIVNPLNGVAGDTRTSMAVAYTKHQLDAANAETDLTKRAKLRKDASDIFRHYVETSTGLAQEMQSLRLWNEVMGIHPDLVGETAKNVAEEKNKRFFDENKADIKSAKDIIDEFVNSKDFQSKFKKKPESKKEVNKRIEQGKAKMADALDRLATLRGIKKNAVSDNMINDNEYAIVKDFASGLLDVGIGSTADLINKLKVNLREYFTPSEIDKVSKKIIKETDAANRLEKKTRKFALNEDAETALVDKLYAKMAIADKKQLRKLVADNMELFAREGVIEDRAFRELFAKALDQEFVSDAQVKKLKDAAEKLNDVTNIEKNIDALFDEYAEAVETKKDEKVVRKIQKAVKDQLKAYKKAMVDAGIASQSISKEFAESTTTVKLFATNIQGNLLTPASQLVNVVSNISWLPVRTAKNAMASILDSFLSGMGDTLRTVIKKNLKVRNPYWNNVLNVMLSEQRTFKGVGLNKGFLEGASEGTLEGLRQMWLGQMPDDLYRRDLNKAIHPFESWVRLIGQMKGTEKKSAVNALNDFIEGTLSVPPEIMFRFLNLGDKPFRRAAERAKLDELASIKEEQWKKDYLVRIADEKGLEGDELKLFLKTPDADTQKAMEAEWKVWRQRFMERPDEESFEIAREAGLEATYQQDNILSDAIKGMDKLVQEKARANIDYLDKTVQSLYRLLRVTQMPYIKTPTNILFETLDYAVPALSASKGVFFALKGDRRKAVDNFARALTGAMLNHAVGLLFGTGIMSLAAGGVGDDELVAKSVRAAEYREKPAYYINTTALNRLLRNMVYGERNDLSFRKGDNMSSYKRFGLVSSLLMTHAEAYRGLTQQEIKDLSLGSRLTSATFPSIRSGLDQSYVAGLSSLLNAIKGSDYERESWLFNTSRALNAAAFPNTIRSFNQARDNHIRETRNKALKDYEALGYRIKADFKSATKRENGLPAKVTVWGEPVKRFKDGVHPIFRIFDITRSQEYKGDFGTKLFEVYSKTKDKSMLLSPLQDYVRYAGQNVYLPPKTWERMAKEVGGDYKQLIQPIIDSKEFGEMDDDTKLEFVKDLFAGRIGSNKFPKRSDLVNKFVSDNQFEIDKLFIEQHGKGKYNEWLLKQIEKKSK